MVFNFCNPYILKYRALMNCFTKMKPR
uniref:Uncharacterized protein n=1 Tax=Rhizophora mucronata TaxID=61149 RepID=A0A2P2NIG4_RHIMU